jgi:curved DNA-binding protein CbpA
MDDLYRVLDVDASADSPAIRVAYRALAAVYHPDHAGAGGEPRMRELNLAWEVLRDPKRRAAYDMERRANRPADVPTGPAPPPWTGRAGPPPGHSSGSVLHFGIFAGWSLGEIARRDPGYLQWLVNNRGASGGDSDAPKGCPYLEEIDGILGRLGLRRDRAPSGRAQPRRRFRFRPKDGGDGADPPRSTRTTVPISPRRGIAGRPRPGSARRACEARCSRAPRPCGPRS